MIEAVNPYLESRLPDMLQQFLRNFIPQLYEVKRRVEAQTLLHCEKRNVSVNTMRILHISIYLWLNERY